MKYGFRAHTHTTLQLQLTHEPLGPAAAEPCPCCRSMTLGVASVEISCSSRLSPVTASVRRPQLSN